jgi:hypothetical protein
MICPICGHNEQRVNIDQFCTFDTPDINYRVTFAESVNCVCCKKCNLTLWSMNEGWRDHTGTTLYWDDHLQRLNTGKCETVTEDSLMNEIKKLGKDKMSQLIQALKEETKSCL